MSTMKMVKVLVAFILGEPASEAAISRVYCEVFSKFSPDPMVRFPLVPSRLKTSIPDLSTIV